MSVMVVSGDDSVGASRQAVNAEPRCVARGWCAVDSAGRSSSLSHAARHSATLLVG